MLYFVLCLTAHLNNKLKSNKFVFILTCLGNIRSAFFLHYIMLHLCSHNVKQSCPLRTMQKYLPSLPADIICSFRKIKIKNLSHIFVFINFVIYAQNDSWHGVIQQMYRRSCLLLANVFFWGDSWLWVAHLQLWLHYT